MDGRVVKTGTHLIAPPWHFVLLRRQNEAQAIDTAGHVAGSFLKLVEVNKLSLIYLKIIDFPWFFQCFLKIVNLYV